VTVQLVSGDMFESGADALVNPVNCIGVSGAGLAKIFARRFPREQMKYEGAAGRGELHLGDLFVVARTERPKHIVYFPTKDHWRSSSRLEDIHEGLFKLRAWLQTTPLHSIAVPALGCGNGRLPWSVVSKSTQQILGTVKRVEVLLYEPHETSR